MSGRAPPITEYRRTAHAPLSDKKRCYAGYLPPSLGYHPSMSMVE